MIKYKVKGDFKKTKNFLLDFSNISKKIDLKKYAEIGLANLQLLTPKDTGLTAASWNYEIVEKKNGASIIFSNNNIQNGINIAVILQYGHATRSGAWVEGIDYINPAMQIAINSLLEDIRKEVE